MMVVVAVATVTFTYRRGEEELADGRDEEVAETAEMVTATKTHRSVPEERPFRCTPTVPWLVLAASTHTRAPRREKSDGAPSVVVARASFPSRFPIPFPKTQNGSTLRFREGNREDFQDTVRCEDNGPELRVLTDSPRTGNL